MTATTTTLLQQCKYLTLSFSGAGHLLPYHLGVASVLRTHNKSSNNNSNNNNNNVAKNKKKKQLPAITAVSGSSSGAIAAAIYVYFPTTATSNNAQKNDNRIVEYADRFITDGGRAMHHFETMLDEIIAEEEESYSSSAGMMKKNEIGEEEQRQRQRQRQQQQRQHNNTNPSLHIATTKCSDGSLRLFDFPSELHSSNSKKTPSIDRDHLLKCLRASCKIPRYFHPSDVLQSGNPLWASSSSSPSPTYPEEDGVFIDGTSYVDGGISAPAPPTPSDSTTMMEGGASRRVVISPISGGEESDDGNAMIRISPRDDSWKFPWDLKCRGGFAVHPSVQNFKALQVSAGLASPVVLREWFERGIDDGMRIFDSI